MVNSNKYEIYEKMFNLCNDIIKDSSDKNLVSKKNKLEQLFYNLKVVEEDNSQSEILFRSIVYEIRLYDYIKRLGFNIIASNDNKAGPDFHIPDVCYIEAVLASTGKEDIINISKLKGISATTSDNPKWGVSRLTYSFIEKSNKYLEYIKKGILNKTPKVIAIDGSILAYKTFKSILNEKMKQVLYGIGPIQYTFMDNNLFVNKQFISSVSKINSLSQIELAYFMNPLYNHISAVILNYNYFSDNFMEDIIIYINPNAIEKLNKENFINKIKCYDIVDFDEKSNTYKFNIL